MQDKDLQILIQAAKAGGEVLNKYFGQALRPTEKSNHFDFQTEADLESEKAILSIIKKEFPDYSIYSEEEGKTQNNSEYTVIIDPLDGTNNFIIGIPNFSVSIALFHNNEPYIGVLYRPLTREVYYAIKGKGAYCNDVKISVNNFTEPKKITIAGIYGYKIKRSYIARVFSTIFNQTMKRVLDTWSPAYDYCMLAAGRIESCFTNGIEIYDYAAGKLIALEAGAKVIDFSGNKEENYKNDRFIISNTDEVNKYVLHTMGSVKED